MPVYQVSRIQVRSGLKSELTTLSRGELAWCVDTQELYIGTGTQAEGAPFQGVVLINGGGGSGGSNVSLENNGNLNSSQVVLNVTSNTGNNIAITDMGSGDIAFDTNGSLLLWAPDAGNTVTVGSKINGTGQGVGSGTLALPANVGIYWNVLVNGSPFFIPLYPFSIIP